jgi:hypothetical protein
MYREKLDSLRQQLRWYGEKTRELKLLWHDAEHVPAGPGQMLKDYFFTWGKFYHSSETDKPIVAVFVTNPNLKINIYNPYGFMFVRLPEGDVQDVIDSFYEHVCRPDMGEWIGGKLVIKGARAEKGRYENDARKFTRIINKEIMILYSVVTGYVEQSTRDRSEVDLLLRSLGPFNLPC